MDMAAGLANVVAAFAAVPGVETASTDPADVIAPGVLVQLVSIGPDTLATRELGVQALLVVPDSDGGPGPAAALSVLLAAVEAAGISADDTILARSVVLPSNPAPLPGLLIPLTVRIPA
jgi:hypothetical protein